MSFKPNTDDMREARSITIIKQLLTEGANIKAYDPAAIPNAKSIFGNKIRYAFSPLLSKLMLGNHQYAYLFQVASFTLFTAVLSPMLTAFIQGLQMFSRLALILLASRIVRVTVSALLLTLAFSVEALLLGSIAFNLILIVLALPPTLSKLLRQSNSRFPQPIKPLLSFALPWPATSS